MKVALFAVGRMPLLDGQRSLPFLLTLKAANLAHLAAAHKPQGVSALLAGILVR